ncbi:hypothetical protein OAR19_00295 [bacterium]|nr:hypothetical protein [bacterium]
MMDMIQFLPIIGGIAAGLFLTGCPQINKLTGKEAVDTVYKIEETNLYQNEIANNVDPFFNKLKSFISKQIPSQIPKHYQEKINELNEKILEPIKKNGKNWKFETLLGLYLHVSNVGAKPGYQSINEAVVKQLLLKKNTRKQNEIIYKLHAATNGHIFYVNGYSQLLIKVIESKESLSPKSLQEIQKWGDHTYKIKISAQKKLKERNVKHPWQTGKRNTFSNVLPQEVGEGGLPLARRMGVIPELSINSKKKDICHSLYKEDQEQDCVGYLLKAWDLCNSEKHWESKEYYQESKNQCYLKYSQKQKRIEFGKKVDRQVKLLEKRIKELGK